MKTKYTREVLAPVVQESLSIAEVMRRLGLRWSGGLQGHIKKCIERAELDTSHFLGQGRQRGKLPCNRRHWSDILVLRSSDKQKEGIERLRRAMIEAGIPHICGHCGCLPEWNSKPLVLQTEHKNGRWWDCRKENLEFLCPNCHSQTDTWGSRNKICSRAETLVASAA
jgi:hypothetical protein